MTRINCVPVTELERPYLIAEYRELPRVRHAYPRKKPPTIPDSYRMGQGHVTFFFDKGLWLEQRHAELVAEMQRRGYETNLPVLNLSHWPPGAMNDWQPDETAVGVSWGRIRERMEETNG